jgi:hypothetical protein
MMNKNVVIVSPDHLNFVEDNKKDRPLYYT